MRIVLATGRQDTAHLDVKIGASFASKKAVKLNCRRGATPGVCGHQAMDGLRRRVKHG
jgi:hypothetical protein